MNNSSKQWEILLVWIDTVSVMSFCKVKGVLLSSQDEEEDGN